MMPWDVEMLGYGENVSSVCDSSSEGESVCFVSVHCYAIAPSWQSHTLHRNTLCFFCGDDVVSLCRPRIAYGAALVERCSLKRRPPSDRCRASGDAVVVFDAADAAVDLGVGAGARGAMASSADRMRPGP